MRRERATQSDLGSEIRRKAREICRELARIDSIRGWPLLSCSRAGRCECERARSPIGLRRGRCMRVAQLIAGRCSVRVQGCTVRNKSSEIQRQFSFQKTRGIQRQARLICSTVSRSFLVHVQDRPPTRFTLLMIDCHTQIMLLQLQQQQIRVHLWGVGCWACLDWNPLTGLVFGCVCRAGPGLHVHIHKPKSKPIWSISGYSHVAYFLLLSFLWPW